MARQITEAGDRIPARFLVPPPQEAIRPITGIFVSVVCLLFLVFRRWGDPEALALIFIGLMPWLSYILESAKVGSVLDLRFRIEKQERTIEELNFLISFLLPITQLLWLRRLNELKSYKFNNRRYKEENFADIRQLILLRFVAIQPGKSIVSLFETAPDGEYDIHEYLHITSIGKQYLEIRNRVAREENLAAVVEIDNNILIH